MLNYLIDLPIQIGTKLFYCAEEDNELGTDGDFLASVYSGVVIEIRFISNSGFMFKIDSYSYCEGHIEIDSDEINKTVFMCEQDAKNAIK